jgi:hypothetical protein
MFTGSATAIARVPTPPPLNGATAASGARPMASDRSDGRPAGYQLVTSGRLLAGSGQTYGEAVCPLGTVPLGGGVLAGTGLTLNSSYPTAGGWLGRVNNRLDHEIGFVVEAICAKKPRKYAVVRIAASGPGTAETSASVACPAASVLGGGVWIASASTAVNIVSTYPANKGWRVEVSNAEVIPAPFVVYAICGKERGYVLAQSQPVPNPPGAVTRAKAVCPAPTVPVGGGGVSSAGGISVVMETTASSDSGGPGWVAYELNRSVATSTITAWAVCAGTP